MNRSKLVFIVFVAVLAALIGYTVVGWYSFFQEGGVVSPLRVEVAVDPVVVDRDGSCVDALQQYESEVQARIDGAVALERARWAGMRANAKGEMHGIYEDGSFTLPDGTSGCMQYTLCDINNPLIWAPQDMLVFTPEDFQ